MSSISERAAEKYAARKALVAAKFPGLVSTKREKAEPAAWVLGRNEAGKAVALSWEALARHLFVGGATGGGKSFFYQNGYRQLLLSGTCGLGVVDQHGSHADSLYRDCVGFAHRYKLLEQRVVHLVDPSV